MTYIGKLIDNIYKYGNCKIYMLPRDNSCANNVYDLIVDENGNLKISVELEVYDKPYFDGEKFDKTAVIKSSNKLFDLTDENINMVLPKVVYASICNHKLGIVTNKDKAKNTDMIVYKLCDLVNSMLNLSSSELSDMVISGQTLGETILINRSLEIIDHEQYDVNTFSSLIEKKATNISNQYNDILTLYNELNSAKTASELNKLYRKWTKYYDNLSSMDNEDKVNKKMI